MDPNGDSFPREDGHDDVANDRDGLLSKELAERDQDGEIAGLQASCKQLRYVLGWVSVLLALASVGFVVASILASGYGRSNKAVLSPVPPMPTVPVMFERNELFAGPLSPENDEAWARLVPKGDGFIIVNDPEKHDLPPGQKLERGQMYDISLFHQLHCLTNLRSHFYLLQDSLGRENSEEIQESLLNGGDHVHHCFDYIRQALMCAGDMTVEWPREEEDGTREAFDGWGITHQCKSWDAIMEFMRDNDIHNAY